MQLACSFPGRDLGIFCAVAFRNGGGAQPFSKKTRAHLSTYKWAFEKKKRSRRERFATRNEAAAVFHGHANGATIAFCKAKGVSVSEARRRHDKRRARIKASNFLNECEPTLVALLFFCATAVFVSQPLRCLNTQTPALALEEKTSTTFFWGGGVFLGRA